MNVVDSSVDKKLSLSCSFYSLSSLSDLKMMSGFNSSSAAGDQVSGGLLRFDSAINSQLMDVGEVCLEVKIF